MASRRMLQEEIREGLEERRSRNRDLNPRRRGLMKAVRGQTLDKLDDLLDQGVDPNFRDASGNYPLHVACSADVAEEMSVAEQVVERLVYMGADLEVQDRFSRLPLHVATSTSPGIVRILLDKGCSVNAQDNAGCTALMVACSSQCPRPVDTLTLLLQYSANVHLVDNEGLTALHYICRCCKQDIEVRNQMALLLLHGGLSAAACDREGKMAICHELDQLRFTIDHMLSPLRLTLLETLVCAGSNLRHNSKLHLYWVNFFVNNVSPTVLLKLISLCSPVLSRPALRMIGRAVMNLKADSQDSCGNAIHILQKEVTRLLNSVDSLQCLCRLSLRAHLRGKLLVKVPQLPLPNKLKNFLTSVDPKPV